MPKRAEERKAELVAAALALVRERLPEAEVPMAERFVLRWFRDIAPADLLGADPLDLYGKAVAHLRFGRQRQPGAAKVRVYNPNVEQHGWQSTHTIVEIVNDDMPFLVDSVGMELTRRGFGIHLVVHPIYRVRRDGDGRLLDIAEAVPGESGDPGTRPESFMHVEVDRHSDPAALGRLEADLLRVLGDVRRAVSDWRAMRERVEAAVGDCRPPAGAADPATLGEVEAFLRWLADDNFTFLGYVANDLVEGEHGPALRRVPGSALGILAGAEGESFSRSFQELPPSARERARDPAVPLIVTKASSRSTVHRAVYLDYVGVKRYGSGGEVLGEHRFLGLFTSAAYSRTPRNIPLIRRKVERIVERAGHSRTSHAGKALLHILETYPRDELFQIEEDELFRIATEILHIQDRHRIRLFLRRDPFGRFATCLVYVPRERYNTALRERFQQILTSSLGGVEAEFQALLSEAVLARILFTVRTPNGLPDDIDAEEIERKLVEASWSWTDRLARALEESLGEEAGNRLFRAYGPAFPAAYREGVPARAAVADIRHIDALARGEGPDLAMSLYHRLEDPDERLRFRLIRKDEPIRLSEALPILENMGLEVLAEEPFLVRTEAGRLFAIHDFVMRPLATGPAQAGTGGAIDVEAVRHAFQETFLEVWRGRIENDGFNRLVLLGGLEPRRIVVLRACCKYLLQLGIPFSQAYVEQTLAKNASLAGALARLFDARFDPALQDREPVVRELERAIERGLEQVQSLDEDRIVRAYLGLVRAALRTNHFQRGPDGHPKDYLSIKLDPAKVPGMPLPKPAFEIFVYAPFVEGVHLRGGKVARGGLRWSDRREDFRTEILGLMKAQMVKNAVIVPVGAKGGFVVKRPPAGGDRAALQEEAVRCYRTLLRGLLDITDNRTREGIRPPQGVVRWDDDDPYLVVAADKGTATFSDIANGVSRDYGFWLDDAFASGGSAGYDHKAMGITAKGAWESVKRHFRELGRDPETEPFTCVGIGDMSGDVFGNGMLLSRRIRLLAAFDHRHVFLDPDPDLTVSFTERERLFGLPRSSWADYDPAKISKGGGVFPRAAKSIELTPEVRAALAVEAERLTPAELIAAILKAPVDLLWNGGIGTYVKATFESHADAQDRANDALRVNGADLRCKVVAEGGNLGFTQHGRIEYAIAGGRLNTDFIDNSAGVDCSDHEVNIKILLGDVVAAGDLTLKQRDGLLAAMTDEVAGLVLRDNALQNLALSAAQAIGPDLADAEIRLMRRLEAKGRLDRDLEDLPTDDALQERRKAGRGLTRPETAVLLAYAKMAIYDELLAGELPDRAYFAGDLAKYFPRALRRRFAGPIERHRLRREIVATWLANSLVNRGLHVFVSELEDETGATLEDIALGFVVARDSYGLLPLWNAVEALPTAVPAELQLRLLVESRRVLQRGTRWFLAHAGRPLRIRDAVGRFKPGIARIMAALEEVSSERPAALLTAAVEELAAQGLPRDLARSVASLPWLPAASDIVMVAYETGTGTTAAYEPGGEAERLLTAARLYLALDEALRASWLRGLLNAVPVRSRWDRLALAGLEDQLAGALRRLTVALVARGLAAGAAGGATSTVAVAAAAPQVAAIPVAAAGPALVAASTPAGALAAAAARDVGAVPPAAGSGLGAASTAGVAARASTPTAAAAEVAEFLRARVHGLARYRALLDELAAVPQPDLAMLTVAVRVLDDLKPLG